jgi:hypothetical protein
MGLQPRLARKFPVPRERESYIRLNENLSTYSTYASICRPGNLILIETGFFRPFDSSARCQRIRAILRLDSTRLDWSGRTVQTVNTRQEGLARSLRTGEIDLLLARCLVFNSSQGLLVLYSQPAHARLQAIRTPLPRWLPLRPQRRRRQQQPRRPQSSSSGPSIPSRPRPSPPPPTATKADRKPVCLLSGVSSSAVSTRTRAGGGTVK